MRRLSRSRGRPSIRHAPGMIRVPAWLVVPAWALIELAHGLGGTELGVAHWAHVGGFGFGAIAAVVAHRMKLVYVDGGVG
jgi:membrane associated rhomboid family serine protease